MDLIVSSRLFGCPPCKPGGIFGMKTDSGAEVVGCNECRRHAGARDFSLTSQECPEPAWFWDFLKLLTCLHPPRAYASGGAEETI